MLAELIVIPLYRLAVALLPVVIVAMLLWRWSLRPGEAAYATARMLVQLLLIGYILDMLFKANQPALVGLALVVMLLAAGSIALRTTKDRSYAHYRKVLIALSLGGGFTLLVVTQGVLVLQPWFEPRKVVTLGGMILANGMNSIALAAERLASESERGALYPVARQTAMRAALIPATNGLLAVGLVSIPGFMAGQMIDDVDPLIAARYQIMVMAMVYGSAGLSAGCYLALMKPNCGGVDSNADEEVSPVQIPADRDRQH